MITASYLSMAGAAHGSPARWSPLERAKAAHSVGIQAIGVRLEEEMDPAILRYVQVPEIEWVDLDQPLSPKDAVRIDVLAHDYGAQRLNVGLCKFGVPWWLAARNLMTVLRTTSPLGMTVAVEPVVFGELSTIADIQQVIDFAAPGDPKVGLLYDMCQVQLGTPYAQALGADFLTNSAPPPRVAEVQVCGVGYRTPGRSCMDMTQDRPPISQSSVNIRQWLAALQNAGVDAPVSYELPTALSRYPEMSLSLLAKRVADDMAVIG